MSQRPAQPRGLPYYLACLSAVSALIIAWLPWPSADKLLQVIAIMGLIIVAGLLLWWNQRKSPQELWLQTLTHLFLLGGVILLPLEDVPDWLHGWLLGSSLTCLALYGYCLWRKRSERTAASPPSGDY